VADDPADRVHLPAVPGTVFFGDAGQAATPLAAGEAKLLD
jgi:hypothetical protein